ncbi:UvrD-helicase domain-containing protein [Staphylococcus pettenkoferi]|uniref:UvrD-helicase domain-containing protein n=1 Tax=Staphylococcus pettenkoferi TaxID=170573 RepID=UPI001BCD99CC|nr:ATP-dependent helicase [Staphylococcus pettenkoferi]
MTKNYDGNFLNEENKHNEIAKNYHRYLKTHRLIDYDLILYYSYKLIEEYPIIAYNLSRIFHYFLIDEYQDTREIQYLIIGRIIASSKGNCKYFIVGDVNQAIYHSLGGKVKPIDEIEKIMGNYPLMRFTLYYNYRSSQKIIDFYSQFSCSNHKIESAYPEKYKESIIEVDKSISKNKLSERISEIIKKHILEGVHPNEICIIAPQWNILNNTIKEIISELPNVKFNASNLTVMSRVPHNIWFKFACLILTIASPNNYTSRLSKAKDILNELDVKFDISFVDNEYTPRMILNIINSIQINNKLITHYLEECFLFIMEKLNINHEDYKDLVQGWQEDFGALQRNINNYQFKDLPSDANYITKMFNSIDGININTIHGVKGKEYHTIIVFGLHEGRIPHWTTINKYPEYRTEESKKLLYVVCSRAKVNLYLFAEKDRKTKEGELYEINSQLNNITTDESSI